MDILTAYETTSRLYHVAQRIYTVFALVCAVAVLVMLGLTLLNKSALRRKTEFLYIGNRALVAGFAVYWLTWCLYIGVVIAYLRSITGEFIGGEYEVSGLFPLHTLPLLISAQLPFLFLWRRMRTKTWVTILVAASSLIIPYYETINVFLTGLFRDYLPSSWSSYQDKPEVWVYVLAAAPAYFAIVYVLAGERARKQEEIF